MTKSHFTDEMSFDTNETQKIDIAKPGRPLGSTKPDSMKKKNLVQFRISDEEKESIEKALRKTGIAGVSTFCRMAIQAELDRLGVY